MIDDAKGSAHFERERAFLNKVLLLTSSDAHPAAAGVATRVFSGLVLAATTVAVAWMGVSGYHFLNDSVIAPVDLSVGSNQVVPTSISVNRIAADRDALNIRIQEDQEAVDVASRNAERLTALRDTLIRSIERLKALAERANGSGLTDQNLLARQAIILRREVAAQRAYVSELARSYKVGLARKSDLLHEQGELARLRLALIDVKRSWLQSEEQRGSSEPSAAASTQPVEVSPELTQQQDQLVRTEMDLAKLESEKRVRLEDLQAARAQLPRLAELEKQVQGQPLLRAARSGESGAFVPYAQVSGVKQGSTVYQCQLWGVFSCNAVGKVTELLPGEVSSPDSFGGNTRGQYLLLRLSDPLAAKAKSLRVRPDGQS